MGKAYKEKLIKYGKTFDSEEKLQHRVNRHGVRIQKRMARPWRIEKVPHHEKRVYSIVPSTL